jgi:hypothetical protein
VKASFSAVGPHDASLAHGGIAVDPRPVLRAFEPTR